jgi:hypothetical protein
MNLYTCELCGKRSHDQTHFVVPFYFTVLGGPDDDAWGKHSNVAKVCESHLEDYDWPISTTDLRRPSDFFSPLSKLERAVTAIVEQRRIPDDVEPDYYFAHDYPRREN